VGFATLLMQGRAAPHPDRAFGAQRAGEFLFYNIKSFQFSKELSELTQDL